MQSILYREWEWIVWLQHIILGTDQSILYLVFHMWCVVYKTYIIDGRYTNNGLEPNNIKFQLILSLRYEQNIKYDIESNEWQLWDAYGKKKIRLYLIMELWMVWFFFFIYILGLDNK